MILRQLVVGIFEVNCYVLGHEKSSNCVVIDPGGDVDRIVGVLREEAFALKHILLTHGHVDHAGGVKRLQDECGGELIMHREDLPLLNMVNAQAQAFGLPEAGNPGVDRFVEEGEGIDVDGLHLEVIHTPGHSPGGVVYKCGNTLFVGDTLFAGSIGRTDLPGGSFETLIGSIRTKLFPLGDAAKVLPGHGPATTIGDEKVHNPFLRDVYMA